MIRGTFANIRLRNQLLDGVEGGFTRDFTRPTRSRSFIYDASQAYPAAGIPLVVLVRQGVRLRLVARLGGQGHRAARRPRRHRRVLRAHPPLEPDRHGRPAAAVPGGRDADSLGLTGEETFAFTGLTALNEGTTPQTVHVKATQADGDDVEFDAVVRIDTPGEADYYRHGGILQYVLRSLLS